MGPVGVQVRDNKPPAPRVLNYYTEQLEIFGHQREQMRTMVAKWSTLLEEDVM
jgi:hypothetical protein